MSKYFQGLDNNGEPIFASSPTPNPIIAKKPIFKQKSLTGGGLIKASSPSFSNAPITRFIAYKKCCPPTCDPNYILELEELETLPPSTNPLLYSNGTASIPFGVRTNTITPCDNNLILVGLYPNLLGNAIAVLTSINTNFLTLLVKNTVTGVIYPYNVSNALYPGVQAGGNLSEYKIYWWTNLSSIPTTPGIYQFTFI